jgi:hypothetical protein
VVVAWCLRVTLRARGSLTDGPYPAKLMLMRGNLMETGVLSIALLSNTPCLFDNVYILLRQRSSQSTSLLTRGTFEVTSDELVKMSGFFLD